MTKFDQITIDLVNKIANLSLHNCPIEREWLLIIDWLTNPKCQLNEVCHPADRVRLRYREYAMAELIRLKWDTKFKAFKVPTVHRKLYKLEGNLWFRVLNLVQEVFLLNRSGYYHPAEWFACILIESKLVGVFATDLGKDQFFKQLRSENKQLLTLNNPFYSSNCPHTWKLIQQSMRFADQLDQFRTGTYTPMVKARQALTTYLASEAKVLEPTNQGAIVHRQGRKRSLSISWN